MKKFLPSLAAAGIVAVAASGSALAAHMPATMTSSAAAGGTVLNVTALASGLKFSTGALKAKAGKITIKLTNRSLLPHDLVVETGETILAKTPLLAKGKTGSLTVTLKKGTYDFVCDVPGHEDAGMKGKLVVS
jgi:uncharacterized cupredoxin-like copper-binding protein